MPTAEAVKAEETLIHVLWINAGLSCDGDSVALTAATQPTVEEIALGRHGTRVAYVLGGRAPAGAAAAGPARPQAWIDKTSLVPFRLVADLGGVRRDVRLEHPVPAPPAAGEKAPPPAAADLFPRAIELAGAGGVEARLVVDRVTPNARLADSLF